MDLSLDEARRRFAASPSAVLATADSTGQPHIVPVTFLCVDEHVYIAIDDKPKRSADPSRLRRLRNIAQNPQVSLLVQHYADDWSQLWWVRADGLAAVVDLRDAAAPAGLLDAFQERYPFYREHPPSGPLIDVTVGRWSGWSFSS